MDRVDILTAHRAVPRPSSPLLRAASAAVPFRTIIASLSVLLYSRAYHLAVLGCHAGRIIGFQTYISTKFAAGLSWATLAQTWESKRVQTIRQRLFRDFATWVLGSGNGLILTVFWPGWLVVGPAAIAVWRACG